MKRKRARTLKSHRYPRSGLACRWKMGQPAHSRSLLRTGKTHLAAGLCTNDKRDQRRAQERDERQRIQKLKLTVLDRPLPHQHHLPPLHHCEYLPPPTARVSDRKPETRKMHWQPGTHRDDHAGGVEQRGREEHSSGICR